MVTIIILLHNLFFTELNFHDESLPFLTEKDLEKIFDKNCGDLAVFRRRLAEQIPSETLEKDFHIETKTKKSNQRLDYMDVQDSIVRTILFNIFNYI